MIVTNSDNFAREVSRQQPCPLCNGEDWCYLISDRQGEPEKIIQAVKYPLIRQPEWRTITAATLPLSSTTLSRHKALLPSGRQLIPLFFWREPTVKSTAFSKSPLPIVLPAWLRRL